MSLTWLILQVSYGFSGLAYTQNPPIYIISWAPTCLNGRNPILFPKFLLCTVLSRPLRFSQITRCWLCLGTSIFAPSFSAAYRSISPLPPAAFPLDLSCQYPFPPQKAEKGQLPLENSPITGMFQIRASRSLFTLFLRTQIPWRGPVPGKSTVLN